MRRIRIPPLPDRIRIRRPRVDVHVKGFSLVFSERTYVMGILNVTPDSFSDGGKFFSTKAAIARALKLSRDGADIIDIGGESTRPGALEVDADREIERVRRVIEGVRKEIDIPISIDTRKSEVAEEAIRSGAVIVNDVSGLTHDRKMASIVAKHGAALIVTHMKGAPQDMQDSPTYRNLIEEVIGGLKGSIDIARRAGIGEDMIIIDPGVGFGKTANHNLEILKRLDEFKILGRPICIGTSRKSFIGKVLDIPRPESRLSGSIATSVIAIINGANIIRAHDVKQACEAARMTDSVLDSTSN